MPYSYPNNVPAVAKNWTPAEQKRCIAAANAVLEADGEDAEQNSIFACIRAAGKTEHPGGKAMYEPEDSLKAETYGGIERKKLKDSDFVFSDERAFPVMTAKDVKDAVSSWGRYRGGKSFEEFKRRLTALAKRKGLTSSLPKEWSQSVKAVEDTVEWVLDILAVPFGSPDNRDSQGEYFDAQTHLHEDKYPLPPLVYHHGMTDGLQAKEETPEYLGKTIKRWVDGAGVWVRGVLDKTAARAKVVWEAAKQGLARASSGSTHLARVDQDGHIREWPVSEISIFDVSDGRQPANRHAVAIPAMKAIYERAGLPLPDDITPEAAQEAAQETVKVASAATAGQGETKATSTGQGDYEMETKEVTQLVQQLFADQAKKEQEEAAAAKRDAEQAALKAENEKLKEELKAKKVADNRLPGGTPYVAQHSDTWKYDNLDVGEHALLVAMLESAQFARPGNRPATDAAIKALAMKVESEAEKSEPARLANWHLKAIPVKTNEIERTTLTSYGDEWIGVAYSQDLWEKIRVEAWVLDRLMRNGRVVTIPDGFESGVIPYEGADPTWYKVAQAVSTETTETAGAYYRPAVTVPSSRVATAQRTISIAKMGCRVLYTGEMTEDSLIGFVAQARRQIVEGGSEMFDHAILNGDTEAGASANVNDIAGTAAGTEIFMLVDGFRKLALVTNTANSRAGGALEDTDYLATVKLLGDAGKNASRQDRITLIPDANVYWKSLELSTVKTQDVWPQATLQDGVLTRLWGFELRPSFLMHFDEAAVISGAYMLKTNSAGKLDIDTQANNTYGALLAVRWDQWAIAWKRRLTLETSRYIESDTNQIVAIARWGMAYRDTEASSISYGLSV